MPVLARQVFPAPPCLQCAHSPSGLCEGKQRLALQGECSPLLSTCLQMLVDQVREAVGRRLPQEDSMLGCLGSHAPVFLASCPSIVQPFACPPVRPAMSACPPGAHALVTFEVLPTPTCVADDDDNVEVRAVRQIKKGEEITLSYQPQVIHRPDMSLYIYGGWKGGRMGLQSAHAKS